MHFSLRSTIFWNIFILMTVAIVLVGMVVLRVTEREMYRQQTGAGKMIFAAVAAGLSPVLLQSPELLEHPAQESELAALFSTLVRTGVCRSIVLVNQRNGIVAQAGMQQTGGVLADRDIQQSIFTRGTVAATYREDSAIGPHLAVAGPVYLQGSQAGILKMAFSLQEVQQNIRKASNMILLYIAVDAILLIAFGFFLLSRYLVTPLKKLTSLTENIASGDIDGIPLFFSDKNEIGKLSTALKVMTEKLKQERDKIQQQMRALEAKNAQLQQAHREVLHSEKLASVGRLAAGIAHEIGNPIGIILGYLHMLRSGDTPAPERADYLNRIEAETERVHGIISDLLGFAQPATQDKQPCFLNALITDTCAFVSCQKDFRDIAFVFNLAEDLPAVYANEKMLRQLIMNLVLNARDAMANGGTLTLSTGSATDGERGALCFTVADTGTGISPEHQAKIFDPFFTTKQQGRGTGLGLANVHRIVELSGGSISFASTPGQGTVFTIKFPVQGAEDVKREK